MKSKDGLWRMQGGLYPSCYGIIWAFGKVFDSFLFCLAAVHNFVNEGMMERWMTDARRDIAMALLLDHAFMARCTFRAIGFLFESKN